MKYSFDMTPEERNLDRFKIHPKRLLASVPNNIDDDNDPRLKEIFQKIYDTEFNSYKTRYSGYSEAIYIENQKHQLTEFPLTLHSPNDQIKVTRYLRFLESKKKRISKNVKPLRNTLKSACKGNAEYESIKAWFIEKEFCDSDPFKWKETQRRSLHKTILAYYLRDLFHKGYVEEISHSEMKAIALNSFGVNISIGLIKKIPKLMFPPLPPNMIEIPPFKYT